MKEPLESLAEQVGSRRDFVSPPLDLWHPELSGDIPIYINGQGEWYHDGGKIERFSIVRLFASILRREEDGEYYLVTPHEKWRIKVENHPLLITDIDALLVSGETLLEASLNTGTRIRISEQNPLFLDPAVGGIVAMRLPHGLSALCTRAAWYRLVDMAESSDGTAVLRSGDYEFMLPIG